MTDRIRSLNDAFRRTFSGGQVLITAGISAGGDEFVAEALLAVRTFEDFTPDNDPYGEHDFGAFKVKGRRCMWKIDYYNLALDGHSPNAASPSVTKRVLTIMLAQEW